MTLIEIPQWETINLIEAIWLGSGLLALSFAALRTPALLRDYRDALIANEPDICIIARGYLRREIIRIAQAICVVGIGTYAAQEPPLTPGPAQISVTGLVLTAVLILISLLVALQSFFDWRDRGDIRRIVGKVQTNG